MRPPPGVISEQFQEVDRISHIVSNMDDYGYAVTKVDATDVAAQDIDKTFKSSSTGQDPSAWPTSFPSTSASC
jgi:hypothetical protein